MKGILLGVGVGPGDPELMTIKAMRCIKAADIICLPKASKESCRAYLIAEQAVPEITGKECICLDFKMIREEEELKKLHQRAYQMIQSELSGGKTVAFLTVGDPTIYSTFSYMLEKARSDGFDAEIVSGISSYHAAAARLGIALCEGEEELHIGTGHSNIEELLELPGTKIIMKAGHNIGKVKNILEKAEREKGIRITAISDCGMPGEKRFECASEIPMHEYMTTIIVNNRE